MSTGADCHFTEKEPGCWFYKIQRWPYGATEEYDEHGPFPTFEKAHEHLGNHYPNPGGYSVTDYALATCKHEEREPMAGGVWSCCKKCGWAFNGKEGK